MESAESTKSFVELRDEAHSALYKYWNDGFEGCVVSMACVERALDECLAFIDPVATLRAMVKYAPELAPVTVYLQRARKLKFERN